MICKCGAMVKEAGGAAEMACFRAQTEAERQHLSAKSRLKGEPGRFVRAAGRSMCAPAETSSHRAKTAGARLCAQTTSVVQRRWNAETDNGLTPFHAPSVNARPSIQPASQDPCAIAAHTRFPAGTPGGRTPDARDGPWPIRSRH